MKKSWRLALASLLLATPSTAAPASCTDSGIALQILGSGGPRGLGRASAGYLIWVDGISRIMVDAGGGTFARFHEAGANVSDLELLALSHFHPDHASEVPALLWLQSGIVRFAGPTGSKGYPSTHEFLDGLFGENGTFRAIGERVEFESVTIDVSAEAPTEVFSNESIRVRAIGVPHGDVPALGYRVDVGEYSVAFATDQNGSNPAFTELIEGADVLIAHFSASEQATGFLAALHAKPSVWGQMATDASVGTLVLSHLAGLAPSWPEVPNEAMDEQLADLRSTYDGPLIVAEDLMCIPIR